MRKALILTAIIVLVTAGLARAEVKIATCKLQDVITKSEPGSQALKEIETKTTGLKNQLEKMKKDIEQLQDELQKQNVVLSQSAKADKELEFKRKARDYQDTVQAYQRQVKAEEARVREPVIDVLQQVVTDFGKKNGYDMIIDVVSPGMLYTSDKLDVTNQLIVELNKAWREKKK